jgi:hypothetical protein
LLKRRALYRGNRILQKDEGVDVFIRVTVAIGIIALAWVVVAAVFMYGYRELSITPPTN